MSRKGNRVPPCLQPPYPFCMWAFHEEEYEKGSFTGRLLWNNSMKSSCEPGDFYSWQAYCPNCCHVSSLQTCLDILVLFEAIRLAEIDEEPHIIKHVSLLTVSPLFWTRIPVLKEPWNSWEVTKFILRSWQPKKNSTQDSQNCNHKCPLS